MLGNNYVSRYPSVESIIEFGNRDSGEKWGVGSMGRIGVCKGQNGVRREDNVLIIGGTLVLSL